MDYYGRNYGYNLPYTNSYQVPQPQTQMRTNILYVTGLDDAMARYADPNTIISYRNQNEKFEYEIMTDSYGRKMAKTVEIRPYVAQQEQKQEQAAVVSKEEFDGVKSRLESLEREVLSKHKEDRKRGVTSDE